jgi:glycerophosphoryl diester phosphodiesterase
VARSHGHEWLHPDRASVLAAPDAAPAYAKRNDLHLAVWTVDDPDEMTELAAAGVDAIITNVPDIALQVLA